MTRPTVPGWFWVVSTILLLWSIAGVVAFGAQISMGPAQLAQLPEAQREAFAMMPTWTWTAYGIATVGALAAAICLLLRRKWASPLYLISLIAVIAQFSWTFTVARILESEGPAAAIFPAFIILMGALSLWFAQASSRKSWLA